MNKLKTKDVSKVDYHLKEAEKHLNIAIAELMQSAGGIKERYNLYLQGRDVDGE